MAQPIDEHWLKVYRRVANELEYARKCPECGEDVTVQYCTALTHKLMDEEEDIKYELFSSTAKDETVKWVGYSLALIAQDPTQYGTALGILWDSKKAKDGNHEVQQALEKYEKSVENIDIEALHKRMEMMDKKDDQWVAYCGEHM